MLFDDREKSQETQQFFRACPVTKYQFECVTAMSTLTNSCHHLVPFTTMLLQRGYCILVQAGLRSYTRFIADCNMTKIVSFRS